MAKACSYSCAPPPKGGRGHIFLVFRRHISDNNRNQLIGVYNHTAAGRVPGFVDILVIGGTAAMRPWRGKL